MISRRSLFSFARAAAAVPVAAVIGTGPRDLRVVGNGHVIDGGEFSGALVLDGASNCTVKNCNFTIQPRPEDVAAAIVSRHGSA